ncbi:MAG: hypothetical protein FJW76_02000 [Actinobacteria bacterium]|nr:hypothetical protein [Actinomycetota bacterium]
MMSSSKQSLSQILKLADSVTGKSAIDVATGVLAAAKVIESEAQLRNLLTDGGRQPESRAKLVTDLFTNQIADQALDIVKTAVKTRWSSGAELVEVLEQAGYRIFFSAASLNRFLIE